MHLTFLQIPATTINTLIQLLGCAILGLILSYTKDMAKDVRELKNTMIKHDVLIEEYGEKIKILDDKIYKLQKAS